MWGFVSIFAFFLLSVSFLISNCREYWYVGNLLVGTRTCLCFVVSTVKLAGLEGQFGLLSGYYYRDGGEYWSRGVQSKKEELPFHMNVCLLGGYSAGSNKIHARQDEGCGDNPIILIKKKVKLALPFLLN